VHRYGEDDLVMTTPPETAEGTLSPWWRRAVIATMAIGFAVLILLTAKAYQNAPPHPGARRRSFGKVVFTSAEIALGQQVFLKHGLMANGTVWGHGAYLGPDFSAQHLHLLALDLADRIARQRLPHP
jgi:nitric oxide reductase subunit B